jgi:hypothetical protein
VLLCKGQCWQGHPRKFDALTEDARELRAEHSLLAAEETPQQVYDTTSDEPEKVLNRTRMLGTGSYCLYCYLLRNSVI